MSKETKLPDSIKEYHSQSWQLEMLIAGGVLFSLYNFGNDLRAFFFDIEGIVNLSSHFMIGFFGAYVLTTVLLFGFGANLILRAIWLAYLGISYAFSGGIKYENIRGSEKYKNELRKAPTALDRVETLEKWSKLSFSFAILISFFVVSLIITTALVIWIINGIAPGMGDRPIASYGVVFIMTLVQLGFLDQLFLAKNENSKWGKLSSFLGKVFSFITLTFFYRREALVLRSNVNNWMFYSFAILYLAVSILISVNRVGDFYSSGTFNLNVFDDREFYNVNFRSTMRSNKYENTLNSDNKFGFGGIQSDIVKDDYLKLFVVYRQRFDWQLGDSFEMVKLAKNFPDSLTYDQMVEFRDVENKKWNEGINDFLKVYIDSLQTEKLTWANYTHPKTDEEGYLTYIKINSLSPEKHRIYVKVRYDNDEEIFVEETWLTIPFWKE